MPVASSAPCLRLAGLHKWFGGQHVLDGVDLVVEAASVHALIGPNGAGKSTLINVTSGFLQPQSGSVWLRGESLDGLSPERRARLGLRRTFQGVRGFASMSVFENVLAGAHPSLPSGLLDPLFRPRRVRLSLGGSARVVAELLERLGLGGDAQLPLAALPLGKQRLAGLARVLVAHPEAILLDEPGAGLSEAEAAQLVGVIRDLRSAGTAVLLVEHHMSIVAELADEVTVLDFGRVIARGAWSEVRAHPEVVRAYLGDGDA